MTLVNKKIPASRASNQLSQEASFQLAYLPPASFQADLLKRKNPLYGQKTIQPYLFFRKEKKGGSYV
ncbi:MAG: hypothetical protein D3916_17120 [Candidatus Electrothrix sp. MAN1_4]|nr:hypothetical protein [Candidatus Electrothrix sp. MAN1_4]